MDDDFEKGVEKIETMRDMLKESIKDLIMSCNELDKYIDLLKDPFRMIMSNDIEKTLNEPMHKATLYVMMATNKMEALGKYMNGEEGEDDERSE